ncbi:MAG TPA: hypothetical protein VFF68_13945 [Anaerolineaceae bacterium]|nr:hypothetical protein [Anaerolineaceae bacterium]
MDQQNRTTGGLKLAVFITPHGFGHAARVSAVLNAIHQQYAGVSFEIFTLVPEWFFEDTIEADYRCHCVRTDVGLVQKTPQEADLNATIEQLSSFYPLDPDLISRLAGEIAAQGCQAVLCDVAPLGIAVARQAGIPSILIENFTWDWIYAGYLAEEPRFEPFNRYLQELFSRSDVHIQTIPYCGPQTAERVCHVVARKPRATPQAVRQALGLSMDATMVLVTMGGIAQQYTFLQQLTAHPEIYFVVPAAADSFVRQDNLILLPHHTPLYHPDLVAASDTVVGKVGYSTLAETYRAGIPFAYVPRSNFRESPPLTAFIRQNMPGFEIPDDEFMAGRWIERLAGLVHLPRIRRDEENGADEIARWVLETVRP